MTKQEKGGHIFRSVHAEQEVTNPLTKQDRSIYIFSDVNPDEVRKIEFLNPHAPWGTDATLLPLAPAIDDREEIESYVAALQSDLPAQAGELYLAGVVCTVALVEQDGTTIQAADLMVGDAVLDYEPVGLSPDGSRYVSADFPPGEKTLRPRKAPNFGSMVIEYLKRNDPDGTKGLRFVWSDN